MKLGKLMLTVALLLTGMSPAAAFADTITLTLSNPVQSAAANQTVSYTATVLAPGSNAATVYLNGDSFTFTAPFVLDDSPYFAGFPLSLDPGQSYTGTLFDVPISANAAPGTYYGSFQITGGATDLDTNTLASVNFSTAVTPEPSSLLLLGTGALTAFYFARRRAAQLG